MSDLGELGVLHEEDEEEEEEIGGDLGGTQAYLNVETTSEEEDAGEVPEVAFSLRARRTEEWRRRGQAEERLLCQHEA